MSLYTIGDLHLSFSTDKPMDIFGRCWKNHVAKIEKELEKENNIQRYHRTYWRSFLGTEFRRGTERFKLYHKSARA